MPETIILGLDGANWNLLDPWLEAGDLPNISALRESGVATDMQSELPPVTCPNWRCYSTGKNPGKLGVYWWEKIDTENRTLSTPNSRSFKSENYWDYLADEGRSAGIVNLPMTYPPFEINGYMVAGGPGSEQEEYAYPRELGAELDREGYRLHPEEPVGGKDDAKGGERVVELVDLRLNTFERLLAERDVDVAHCTVFYINVLQHYFWRGEPTRRAWHRIDEHVGSIRKAYPEATLLLMSDHGCVDIDTVFNANSWLEKEGYLVTERGTEDLFARTGINKQNVSKLLHRLGVHGLVTGLIPERLENAVPEDEEGFKREQKLWKVDWERSKAIASGQGLVYLIDDDPDVADELIADLEALESDVTGEPIASDVLRREEAYSGPFVSEAPDIVFDQREGVHTSGGISTKPVFERAGQWEAENVRTGLFLVDGPDVSETTLDAISITDVAPTILTSVGAAVPTDMDGTSLDVFEGKEVSEREPLPYQESDGPGSDGVQSRLEDLGYLE